MEDEDENRRLDMTRNEEDDRKVRSDRPMAAAVVAAMSTDTVVWTSAVIVEGFMDRGGRGYWIYNIFTFSIIGLKMKSKYTQSISN